MAGMTDQELERFLIDDDNHSRPFRLNRLRLLAELPSSPNGFLSFGGIESVSAYEEARSCFVNGLYFSTVLLTLTFFEQYLLGAFHISGADEAKTMSIASALRLARNREIVTEKEFEKLDHLRQVRNAYVHFRDVDHPYSTLRRSVTKNIPFEDLLVQDAKDSIRFMHEFVRLRGI